MATLNIPAQARSSGAFISPSVTVGTWTSFELSLTIPNSTDRTNTNAFIDMKLEYQPTGSTTFKALATAGGWRGSTQLGKNSTVVNPAPGFGAVWNPPLSGGDARVTIISRTALTLGATVTVS